MIRRFSQSLPYFLFALQLTSTASAATTQCASCVECATQIAAAAPGDIVLLTSNITATSASCIPFSAKSGVTFDCQLHEIVGPYNGAIPPYFFGIELSSATNNTIKNCQVRNFYENVRVSSSSGNTFSRITSLNSFQNGIGLQRSDNNTISDSNCTGNANRGIDIYTGVGNTVLNTIVETNTLGLDISLGQNNIIDGLRSTGNTYGVGLAYTSGNVIKNSRIQNSGSGGGIYLPPGFNGKYATNNTFYNNLLKNTLNLNNIDANNKPNLFSVALNCTGPANIVGGRCIGGNYWSSPASSGYSDSCADTDNNSVCDAAFSPATGFSDTYPLAKLPTSGPPPAPGRLRVTVQ